MQNTDTLQTSTPSKALILSSLSIFARKRPGMEIGNYESYKSYRSELRGITRTLSDFRQLQRAVALTEGITAEDILKASERAFSGRLSFTVKGDKVSVDYCAGAYFPTEFRSAACAVLAAALWNNRRLRMPEPVQAPDGEVYGPDKLNAGEWIRTSFRREFGASIQKRWFN